MIQIRFTIFFALFLWSTALSAEPKAEFEVIGWKDNSVFVHRSERGQRDVDGAFKPYRFELLDVYDTKTRKKTESYRQSQGKGPVGKEFEEAKPKDKTPSVTHKSTRGSTSPDKRFFVDRVTQREVVQTSSKKNVCTIKERIQLFDTKEGRVYVLADGELEGTPSSKRSPKCPRVKIRTYWSENSKHVAVTRVVRGNLDLRPANVDDLESFADAPFLPFRTNLLAEGRFKDDPVWTPILRGEFKGVLKTLESAEGKSAKIASAFLLAIDKDTKKKSRRAIDKIFKKIKKKTPWDHAIRAAIYRASGDSKRSRKELDRAIKKSKTYKDLIELGDLFYHVDLDIAAQLYLHAVSHPEAQAEGFDASYGYTLLLRSLLDGGNMLNAQELIEKFDEYKGDFAVQVARYEALRRDKNAANVVADALFENPGICDAYLYAGRALGGKNSRQAMAHFRSAIACDPFLAEAIFLLADLEWRRGNKAGAKELYARYRKIALPRRGDEVRTARRQHAYNLTVGRKKK